MHTQQNTDETISGWSLLLVAAAAAGLKCGATAAANRTTSGRAHQQNNSWESSELRLRLAAIRLAVNVSSNSTSTEFVSFSVLNLVGVIQATLIL